MKREAERIIPRRDRIAGAVAGTVALAVLTMFTFLYAFTPPTVTTVEHQLTMSRE